MEPRVTSSSVAISTTRRFSMYPSTALPRRQQSRSPDFSARSMNARSSRSAEGLRPRLRIASPVFARPMATLPGDHRMMILRQGPVNRKDPGQRDPG